MRGLTFLTELMVTMRLHYLAARAADASTDLTVTTLTSAYALSAHLSGGAGMVGRDYSSALELAPAVQTALPEAMAKDLAPPNFPRLTRSHCTYVRCAKALEARAAPDDRGQPLLPHRETRCASLCPAPGAVL